MDNETVANLIAQYEKVEKVYYDKKGKIWVLFDDKSDIVYCEPFPELDNINYYIVEEKRKIPNSTDKINSG